MELRIVKRKVSPLLREFGGMVEILKEGGFVEVLQYRTYDTRGWWADWQDVPVVEEEEDA